jgi:hypothetical protein
MQGRSEERKGIGYFPPFYDLWVSSQNQKGTWEEFRTELRKRNRTFPFMIL